MGSILGRYSTPDENLQCQIKKYGIEWHGMAWHGIVGWMLFYLSMIDQTSRPVPGYFNVSPWWAPVKMLLLIGSSTVVCREIILILQLPPCTSKVPQVWK
jgi:hypothetical protein